MFIVFAVVSITAPTLGVVVGGKISEKLGGYTGKNALLFCFICSILASLLAFPIPYINRFEVVSVLLWLEFFVGGAILPTLTGLMISSIQKNMRNIGNSVAQFVQNLIGYIPAPILYGLVNDFTGGDDSRWGMVMLMSWSLFAVIALGVAYYF